MLGFKGSSRRSFLSGVTRFFSSSDDTEENSECRVDDMEKKKRQRKGFFRKRSSEQSNGPDTSSFTAFLASFWSTTEEVVQTPRDNERNDTHGIEMNEQSKNSQEDSQVHGKPHGKSNAYFNKYSRGRTVACQETSSDIHNNDNNDTNVSLHTTMRKMDVNTIQRFPVPDMSDDSLLLSKNYSIFLSSALPTLVQGRKWMLLYSTWKHGISLLTLYRKSALCPGPCLLVAGDRKGAVFGGLLAAPLRPSNLKKYQGTNDTFVFTNVSGVPVLFHPTGANRYFVLCSADSLALGGGSHFALYLDGDLLCGSSGSSETFGNSCLANSEDFKLKEVELWGFVHASKFSSGTAPKCDPAGPSGLCRWLGHVF